MHCIIKISVVCQFLGFIVGMVYFKDAASGTTGGAYSWAGPFFFM